MQLVATAIKVLTGCVAVVRGQKPEPDAKLGVGEEFLLGFATLATAEATSLLVLCSLGQERSAKIHFRALNEYRTRASMVLGSEDVALEFEAAAIAETRNLGEMMGLDAPAIDAAIRELIPADNTKDQRREKVVFGDMRAVLKKRTGDDLEYAVTYATASSFAHGSILALREVAQAISGAGDDFPIRLARDRRGAAYLLGANAIVGWFINELDQRFHFEENADFKEYAERNEAIMHRIERGEIAGLSTKRRSP